MYDKILGLDMAKATFDAALLPVDQPHAGQTERPRTRQFANTPEGFAALGAWLTQQQGTTVLACSEATSSYGEALAADLVATGQTVVRANPYQIKHSAQSELQRNSTDRQMAAVIARFARDRQARLPRWTLPDPALAQLQDFMRHLEDLQTLLGQVRNRLERPGPTAPVIASLTETVRHLEQQQAQTHAQLRRLLAEAPTLAAQVALLITIPGVGETPALGAIWHLGGHHTAVCPAWESSAPEGALLSRPGRHSPQSAAQGLLPPLMPSRESEDGGGGGRHAYASHNRGRHPQNAKTV